MLYDMSEIDKIFDDLELNIGSGKGWSNFLINLGMVAVILAAGMMWIKLNSYQSKNA
jgi:hypothetical protein